MHLKIRQTDSLKSFESFSRKGKLHDYEWLVENGIIMIIYAMMICLCVMTA